MKKYSKILFYLISRFFMAVSVLIFQMQGFYKTRQSVFLVIPAKAGIHCARNRRIS
ncbi:Uncharacterized protein dnm_061800 [Desulfonema magnum]|uniref:Uncharacterized protein n=1 Tax=Desulfonema magnum TaxID=45655 RepID=A0A975GQP8_9BACT|nr:Uncharacterized protein dnm_061800 [Desulfonema magnum]